MKQPVAFFTSRVSALRGVSFATLALAAAVSCQGTSESERRPSQAAQADASAPAAANAGAADAGVRSVNFDDVPVPDVASASARSAVAGSPTGTTLDLPITEAWPAVNRWNDAMEREFSAFVRSIGRAVEARRCGRMDRCLADPAINTLYDPATEGRFTLDVDCGDLPYFLRAYFAFKRRLPFGYVDTVSGSGTDPRYMLRVRPRLFRKWNDYRTPRSSLRHVSDAVHSGMYRIEPTQEEGDFYPVSISRQSIRPGSTFYDPNGHVLVVADVREDGNVFMIDGHPDGSLTWKRFGEAFELGPRILFGGFKNWRPQTWDGTTIARAPNRDLRDFDDRMQWTTQLWVDAIPPARRLPPPPNYPRGTVAPGMYHLWVRQLLAAPNVEHDPVRDFREEVQSLCRDVLDRADAVNVALAMRVNQQSHPGALPYNIYGTNGDWELYSTPSRDARLKASVREMFQSVSMAPEGSPLRAQLRAAWEEERARPECQYRYVNTAGATVALTLDAVLDRLFALSFDPYHCPELRWGAAPGSPEIASCTDSADKLGWYRAEQRLRNQIDRFYGVPTPLEMGPATPPDVDFRALLSPGSRR